MKRCPECLRDYTDETLRFCLDDGSVLLDGPGSGSSLRSGSEEFEPQTAILHETSSPGEAATRAQIHTTAAEPQGSMVGESEKHSFSANRAAKPLLVVTTLAVLVIGGFFGYRYFNSSVKQIDSIAVMPFVNDSRNAEMEYLSDGMTETLISSLSQIAGLNVKARSSVFRYKGKETDARTIGKDLGVQAVLNGRLVQRGDQLTLSLELIDAENDNVLWSDKYDRRQADLVSLQSEIARDVSSKLKLKLTSADQLKLAKKYTNDPEVYRLYLQGRYYWNKRTATEVAKGIPFFQQAVEKDPNFALGYVGLADSHEDVDRPRKKDYIRRALEIDDQLAEAHASLGYQYMVDYNWPESERELKRAIELNPNYPQAHQWNGMRLMMNGKLGEARVALLRALELDPTSTGINFYYGVLLEVEGRTTEGIQHSKKLIEMEPTFPWVYVQLARVYRRNGDHQAAVETLARGHELYGNAERARVIRESFAKGGWTAYLRENMKDPAASFGPSGLAELGLYEQAIEAIVKQDEKPTKFWFFMHRTDPFLDPIRNDARFKEAMKKLDPPQ